MNKFYNATIKSPYFKKYEKLCVFICDYYYNCVQQSSNERLFWSKIRSCALIVNILWISFDFHVCCNSTQLNGRSSLHWAFLYTDTKMCTWSEQQAIDSCAQHSVHVTMCISFCFWYLLRDCDYLYLEFFFGPKKKVSPGDLLSFSLAIHFYFWLFGSVVFPFDLTTHDILHILIEFSW